MKTYQHNKYGLFAAFIAAAAMWTTACAPEFTDDVCTKNEDCFANEICLANTCVVATQTNDVGNNGEDGQSDAEIDVGEDTNPPELNACNGLSELDHEPGVPCGPCDLDKYICDGKENSVCDGNTACPEIAIVTTNPSEITATGAKLHGKIQSLSADLPTDHGFCWSTEFLPTAINGKCHSLGALTADKEGSDFTYTISELNPGTIYHVRVFHADSTGTIYGNTVEFTTLAPFPTNLTATKGTETLSVKLAWDDMPGATEYHVYRNDVLLGVVDSDTTTFNDIHADAGQLTAPQNPTASQGTSVSQVDLSANPAGASPGTSQPYAVRASYPNAQSAHSPEVDGYRGVGSISYQWERSAADTNQNFSPLAGATDLNSQDATAPSNGAKRFYRVIASAEGAESKTSAAVSGYRQETSFPAIHLAFVNDITTTTAKLTALFFELGTPPATEHGFCWGTSINPATECIELGTPPTPALPQAAPFDYLLTELTPGTAYHMRAFLTVGTTRHYGNDLAFQTKPDAPVVSATSNNTDIVKVSWAAVHGAATYQVLRDGTPIASGITDLFYDDNQADAAPAAAAPTVTVTNAVDYVQLNWLPAPTSPSGTAHSYTVIAVDSANQKSVPSAPAIGRRKAHAITAYEISIDGDAWLNVGNVLTYNDITANAPIITPGTLSVASGSPENTLTLNGASIAAAAPHSYKVRAVAGLHGNESAPKSGYRLPGPLTIQWQSSTTTDTDDFTNISGATGSQYSVAPGNLYYRAVTSSPGATTKYSNIVQNIP